MLAFSRVSSLYQATAPPAPPELYVGPKGTGGHPTAIRPPPAARSQTLARELWEASSALTGIAYLSNGDA